MEQNIFERGKEKLSRLRLHKRWQKLICVLSALVIACTVYALILPAVAEEAPDMSAYVTDAKFTKIVNGEWVEADSYNSTDQANVEYSFENIPIDNLGTDHSMCIKLPDGMSIPASLIGSGNAVDVRDPNYGVCGSYYLTGDGYAVIKYTDAYIAYKNENDRVITGKIRFDFTWDMSGEKDEVVTKQIVYNQFTKTLTITNTSTSTEEPVGNNYVLNKTSSDIKFDSNGSDDGYIDYTITLEVKNDAESPLVLEDIIDIDGTLLDYENSAFSVDNNNISIQAESVEAESGSTKKTITLSSNTADGKIAAGTYIITYRVMVKGIADPDKSASFNFDTIYNKVSLNGTDKWSETRTSSGKSTISKIGKATEDENGTVSIEWIVYVNSGSVIANLNEGTKFTDQLPADVNLPESVTVTQYDIAGNTQTFNATVDSDGTIKYDFPSGQYKYEIKYTTTLKKNMSELPVGVTTVDNTAQFTDEHGTTTNGPASVSIDKSAVEKQYIDSEREKIEVEVDGELVKKTIWVHNWESTISQDLPEGSTFWDCSPATETSYMQLYMTEEQLAAITVTGYDSEGNLHTLKVGEDYTVESCNCSTASHVGLFQISFHKLVKAPITVSYSTSSDMTEAGNGSWYSQSNYAHVKINGVTDSTLATANLYWNKQGDIDYVYKQAQGNNVQYNYGDDYSEINVSTGDRVIEWLIVLNQSAKDIFGDSDTVYLTDFIPDGLEYVKDSLGVTWYGSDILSDSSKGITYSLDDAEGGKILSVTIPKSCFAAGDNFAPLNVSYKTLITDQDFLGGDVLRKGFDNTAKLTVDDKKYESSHTAYVTRSVVGKSGSYDEHTRTLTYDVVINPDSSDLLSKKDQIRVVDEITNTGVNVSALKLAGVSLFTAISDGNGGYTAGAFVKDMQEASLGEVSYENGTYTYEIANGVPTITAYVSDNQAYVLVYSYQIDADVAGVSIVNKATICGEQDDLDSTEKSNWVENSSMSGEMETNANSIMLKKHDADSYNTLLGGAVFQLYYYDSNNNQWVQIGNTYTTGDGENNSTLGEVRITSNTDIVANRLYKLIEVSAPDGYLCDGEPYYFTITDGTGTEIDIPETDSEETGNNVIAPVEYTKPEKSAIVIDRFDAKDDTYVESNSLKVKKAWIDEDTGEEVTDAIALSKLPSVSVQLCIYSEEDTGHTVTFNGTASGMQWRGVKPVEVPVNDGGSIEWTVVYQDITTNTYNEPTVTPSVSLVKTEGPTNETIKNQWGGDINVCKYSYRIADITEDIVVEMGDIYDTIFYQCQYGIAGYQFTYNVFQDESGEPTQKVVIPVSTVTLSNANGWTYTWDENSDYQLDSNTEYFIREVAVPGYEASYTKYTLLDNAWVSSNLTGDETNMFSVDSDGTRIVVTNAKKQEQSPDVVNTTIKVEKKWKQLNQTDEISHDGTVKLELYQIETDESGTVHGPVKYVNEQADKDGYYTLSSSDDITTNWKLEIAGLPKSVTDAEGNTKTYKYYVVEVSADGKSVPNNNVSVDYDHTQVSAVSGDSDDDTIIITNTVTSESYTLPQTGASGTHMYTIGGIMLALAATLLLYKNKKIRGGVS